MKEKIKNRFKLNIIILYVYLNSFHLFVSIIRIKKFKNSKILRNFDYI